MKILLSWLKDYVDISLTPEELAEKLVSAGFEIEEIINERDAVKNVVVAKVIAVSAHPNADKLQVCSVNVGDSNLQVVTNDKNVIVGDLVPLAIDGAVLANGLNIKAGELRGVKSDGMFCGREELGLDKDEYPGADTEGVLKLRATAVVGSDVNDEIGKIDIILDVSLTANRADCNSVVGIAREVAAVTGVKMREVPTTFKHVKRKSDLIGVTVKDARCPRYMAAEVTDIKICESSDLIKTRLRKVGIRPINNIVDITNYVLIEIGQPMHAFDYSLLRGSEIVVRAAFEGETILALDGKEYVLNNKELVISDAKGAVAIAGVMGGVLSGINAETKDIIFESARFARDSVRLTSRALNLRSDSSQRYEKGVDYYCQPTGLYRALNMIDANGYGTIVGDIFDTNPDVAEKTVDVSEQDIAGILGISVPSKDIAQILNSLDIKTTVNKGVISSIIPLFREDMSGKHDIAEEIIRIYGYGKLTPTLLNNATTVKGGRTIQQASALKLKDYLVGIGSHEIVSYSFVSPKIFKMLNLDENSPLRTAVRIENPIGEDFSVMRTTLAYSMLKTLSLNYQRGNKTGRYFEMAKIYLPKTFPLTEPALEKQTLCLGIIGENEDFYSAKDVLESLLEYAELKVTFHRTALEYLHPTRAAKLVNEQGVEIGYFGEVHPTVADTFGIDKRVYLAELDAEYLCNNAFRQPDYKSISKFQSVERDLAFLVESNIEATAIVDAVRSADTGIIENISIFDVYQGDQVEKGKKSVAIKIVLRDKSGTLRDDTVNAQIDAVLAALEGKVAAKLRS